jgi:hypothetical protein
MIQPLIFCCMLIGGAPPTCGNPLGQDVVRAASERWKDWAVVTLADLRTDDQEIVLKQSGNEPCPGIAVGHFVSASTTSVAILLQRKQGATRLEMVVVGTRAGSGKTRWYTATRESPAAASSVIRRLGPGTYKDRITGRPYEVHHDAIVYEQLESGALLLFHSRGRFKAITLSY